MTLMLVIELRKPVFGPRVCKTVIRGFKYYCRQFDEHAPIRLDHYCFADPYSPY